MNNNIIFVQPLGGLCNRMRVISSAVGLAKELGKELVVVWTQDKSLNAKFSSLFEHFPYKVLDVGLTSFGFRLFKRFLLSICGFRKINNEWIISHARGKQSSTWIPSLAKEKIYIEAFSDFYDVVDFDIFNPSSKVKKDYCVGAKFVGIHIRRTDNEMSIKYSPTELFVNAIKHEIEGNADVQFFLSTDDPNEEYKLKSIFKELIIVHNKRSLDRNDPIAIEDAMIDLYNLSRCGKIYGSFYSSFSDVAAMWGNITKIVLKKII